MNLEKMKLMLLARPGYMNEHEDGDDLGGDVLEVEQDEDEKPTPVEDAEEEAPAEVKEEPKAPKLIPKARFDEVIAERNAERERSADLERRMLALEAASKPKVEEPKVEVKDIDAMETEYANLMLEGDVEKAVKLRSQINKEIRQQAEEAAEQRVERREQAKTQKAVEAELNDMSTQVIGDYPYLDTEAGEMVIPQITALRDVYIGKGMAPAEALRKAADLIAPKFDPDPQGEKEPVAKQTDTRTANAIARGIKDSASQPPQMNGVGNRAMETVKRDVSRMTEEEFDALPEAEIKRLKGA